MKYLLIYAFYFTSLIGSVFQKQFDVAGNNKFEIQKALNLVPEKQFKGMAYLIQHMPEEDLKNLSSDFLLNNCSLAYNAWYQSAWYSEISEELFFNYILPYANLNEKREEWRKEFNEMCLPIIKNAKTISDAVVLLNQNIFEEVGVIYSTDRPKADQAPFESIEAGMASCTGLSILLINACRSIGIPARFVGTPLWYNNSGNHSWVEIWDDGWHYTGAAEPVGDKLNEIWFAEYASKATPGDMKYGIFAVTWENKELYFPMDWLPEVKTYSSIDVTHNYKKGFKPEALIPIRVRFINTAGKRDATDIKVKNKNTIIFEGITKDETFDSNDHLTIMLGKGEVFIFETRYGEKQFIVEEETLLDLGF